MHGGSNTVVQMRKFAHETADLQRWLEAKLAPHRDAHYEKLLAAEAKYKETVEAEPPAEWYRAGTAGYYSKYWQDNCQMFISYMDKWREQDARRLMETEIAKADAEFDANTKELYAIYSSRLEQRLYGRSHHDSTRG